MNWLCKLGIHDYEWVTKKKLVDSLKKPCEDQITVAFLQHGNCKNCGKLKAKVIHIK